MSIVLADPRRVSTNQQVGLNVSNEQYEPILEQTEYISDQNGSLTYHINTSLRLDKL